ncbi:MAG: cadherin-like beta sandwich domain-containing protein [Clostridia bacterium]|nr:cadherin-like beta sandwich domain-containing protein [Clostridia bacterium]
MKNVIRFLSVFLVAVILCAAMVPSVFAKDFAPKINASNIGVNTQYLYSENNVSWLRQLTIKEDMLSSSGILNEAVLHPVTDYPYTTDAPHFKLEVEECVKTYTLDKESQKAAYLYVINQIGALTLISEPTTSNETKADWLRAQGIIVTEEDEKDAERVLLISALYALMRNDFYYVIKGEHYTVPAGTPLEEAVVMYLAAISGHENTLGSFILKFFGKNSFGDLEDYLYYTSLMALYTNGYVSVMEITTLPRDEVYRRLAIMTIRNYGLAIDSEKATTEELQQKYLTAMLGTHYRVSLDPASLVKSTINQGIPYYVLQRMAAEDANMTISHTRYTYEQCFDYVLKKTQRFDLEKEFFSDIYEYNIYLNSKRENISVNPNPLTATSLIKINGVAVVGGQYTKVELTADALQAITITSTYTVNGKSTTSKYKINVIQGTTPPPDSDLTGLVPTMGTSGESGNALVTDSNGNVLITVPPLSVALPYVTGVNGLASNLAGKVLSLNDKGQLVDQYGNIISQGTFETLPEGYKYVLGDDGIIQVVLMNDEESTTADSVLSLDDEDGKVRSIIIIGSVVMCITLILALIITFVIVKKKGNSADKVKARRQKEKDKKAKLEAKEAKKAQKKKK